MGIKIFIGGRSSVLNREHRSEDFVKNFIYRHDIRRIYTYSWLDTVDSFEKIMKIREKIRDKEE